MAQPLPSIQQPDLNIQQSLQFLINNVTSINNTLATSLPAINAKVDSFISEINTVKQLVSTNQEDIKVVFSEVFELKDQLYTLKDQLNAINQEKRLLCVRIFGLPLSEDEIDGPDPAKATVKQAYDRVIKPLLAAAKDRSAIPSVPKNPLEVIKEAFRLRSNPNSRSPPPILLKFSNENYKTASFKSKRDHMPSPSETEKNAGYRRFDMVEDLTPDNRSCLMELREHASVARAWTTSGEIRFTIKGDTTSFVHKVKSPYDSIASILKGKTKPSTDSPAPPSN